MKSTALLFLTCLFLSSAAFAESSKYEFVCNALSAKTQEGGEASGSFTIENGHGSAGFGYPPLSNYLVQILFKIDLATPGTSTATLQVSDESNPEQTLASSNSILHFDGLDQVELKYVAPQDQNEVSIKCSLKSSN